MKTHKMFKAIIVLLLCISYSACSDPNPLYVSGLEGKTLPNYTLILKDSITQFRTEDIKKGDPFFLIFYQPNCPHCQAEIKAITSHIEKFNDIKFYLITSFPFPLIKQFSNYFDLSKYTNVVLVRDSASKMLTYFNAPGVPFIASYNRDKILNKTFLGECDIDDLLNSIRH